MDLKKVLIPLLVSQGVLSQDDAEAMWVGDKSAKWAEKTFRVTDPVDKSIKSLISDKKAKLVRDYLPNRVQRLSDVWHHPELYAEYPEAKDIYWAKQEGGGASYIPELNLIRANNNSDLIHEAQHWISNKQGWPRGGSIEDVRNAPTKMQSVDQRIGSLAIAIKGLGDTHPHIIDNFVKKHGITDVEREMAESAAKSNSLRNLYHLKNQADIDQYKRLAGEALSRDSANRKNLTLPQSQKIPLYGAQEVPQSELIQKLGVAAPVGLVLANRAAEAKAMEEKFEGQGLSEPTIDPVTAAIPAKLGGGIVSTLTDAILQRVLNSEQ